MRRFKFGLVLLAVLLMFFVTSRCVFAVNGVEAEAAITEAESEIVECYGAVAEAERAGANVSDLIVKLDEAGGLLAEAENAYKVGNVRAL